MAAFHELEDRVRRAENAYARARTAHSDSTTVARWGDLVAAVNALRDAKERAEAKRNPARITLATITRGAPFDYGRLKAQRSYLVGFSDGSTSSVGPGTIGNHASDAEVRRYFRNILAEKNIDAGSGTAADHRTMHLSRFPSDATAEERAARANPRRNPRQNPAAWTFTIAPLPGQRVRAKRIVSLWNGTMVGNVATFETATEARLAASQMDDDGIKWTRSNPRRRNPVRPGDDVTKPYPFEKKENEYSHFTGHAPNSATLREYRDQAMQDRDEWSRTSSASQSVEARTASVLKAAEKAHAAAAKQAQHDYAVYGWHADDTITIAQERKRRKERAESRKGDVSDEIAALSNPRHRKTRGNPAGWQYEEARAALARALHSRSEGDRLAATKKIGELARKRRRSFLPNPRRNPGWADRLASKIGVARYTILAHVPGSGEYLAYATTLTKSSANRKAASFRQKYPNAAVKIAAGQGSPKWAEGARAVNPANPAPKVYAEGLPPKPPRGYVRIYTVSGGDMMETPTRRFSRLDDAIDHATRTGRPVVVEDVSKERARRYGVG